MELAMCNVEVCVNKPIVVAYQNMPIPFLHRIDKFTIIMPAD